MTRLTTASNLTFGLALVLYLAAAVGSFHFLAFRRRGVLAAGRVVAFAGLATHGVSVVTRGLAAGRVPWGNMYEYASVLGLLIVAAYLLVIERAWRTEEVRGFAIGTAVLAMAGATLIYVPPGPLVPALNSYWIRIHVVLAVLASSLFILATVFTVLYLVQDRRERRSATAAVLAREPALVGAAGERPEDYAPADGPEEPLTPPAARSRLPAAAALDRMAYRTIVFAFPVWTMAVIAGAIWAEQAWGRYWGWDPKEVWSFVTWVVFAAYLHARATVGWRGRRAATLALAGFGALVFNLVVVNTVIAGLHSYA
ncbi:MAG: c-type cytochrome biogenesis protein CcsB [Actinomycetota bacterium]